MQQVFPLFPSPYARARERIARPIPKERGQITSGVALQNPTHASYLPIDCRRMVLLMKTNASPVLHGEVQSGSDLCLDQHMPVDPDQASRSGIAPITQTGVVAFTTTHWSVVLAAQGPSPAAADALEKLCRTYWRPIYGFVRRQGIRPEEAKDLTQGFFALLLERRDLNAVRKEKGRLRSYLLTCLKHFMTDQRNSATAIKRGQGQQLIPLQDLHERERVGFEAADTLSADRIYERRWALSVLDQVLARLTDEYRAAGNIQLFDCLQKLLTDEPDRLSSAETARELGMTASAVTQASYRMRQRYRQLLREEIAKTVLARGDIEDELRHLVAVLRS